MSAVQSDIDLIFSWLSSRFLSINLNKTKYMIVSRKSASFSLSLTPLYVVNINFNKIIKTTEKSNVGKTEKKRKKNQCRKTCNHINVVMLLHNSN